MCFGKILTLIDEGKVALMRSPGVSTQAPPGRSVTEKEKWIDTQLTFLAKSKTDLVEDSWTTFIGQFSNMTDSEINDAIESEIVSDLVLLQMQSAIHSTYRRFVVIKSEQDNHIEWDRAGVS